MIISLKNNKELLLRRKTFFDNKHSHEELRRIYSQRINRNEKTLTDEERRKIREKIRADFKRDNRIKILVVVGCLILIPTIGYYAFSGITLRSELPAVEVSQQEQAAAFDESIHNGRTNLNKNQPFFAIGHFENALELRRNDPFALEQLISSYEMLCAQHKKACPMASRKIDSLRNQVKELHHPIKAR